MTQNDNLHRAPRLQTPSTGYIHRYKVKGELDDLEASIRLSQEAVDITRPSTLKALRLKIAPQIDPSRVDRLQTLGMAYLAKHERAGEMYDLEISQNNFEEALAGVPGDHPARSGYLHNLANVYNTKYEKTKDLADLQKAVQLNHDSINLLADDHHNRADYLDSLGDKYETKFSRTFSNTDLEMVGMYFQEAVDLTPEEDPRKSHRLSNLALHYHRKHQVSGKQADLDEMTRVFEILSTLNSQEHSLHNLVAVIWRMTKYLKTKDLADLELAIKELEGALVSTPEGHVH